MKTEDVLKTSAQFIKGVGPNKYKLLNRLGIYTLADLIYYFPRRYEDRRSFLPIARVQPQEFATVKGEILKVNLRRSRKGLNIFEVILGDESGVIRGTWFNQPFMQRYFKTGQKVVFYGKVEHFGRLQINNPEFEFISDRDSSIHMGRIVPIYPATARLNQRFLRTVISRALKQCFSFIPDILPYQLRTRLQLLPLTMAVRNIHFPRDFSGREAAYRRLVFDEFFLLQTILALKKARQNKKAGQAVSHQTAGRLIKEFRQSLPFKLTASQQKVIKEIEGDMRAAKRMNRLLQGDVGSGKTVVAAYALVLSAQSGFQAALMAPTEVLAQQHYLLLSRLLLPLDINVGLLISSMSQKAKQDTVEQIQAGTLDIVVGTHALLEGKISFRKLGLAVIDEQHKFGVLQRSALRRKGLHCDCLIMTATPIPRTLAMTIYGHLDVSTIKELPQGRLPVSTFWVREGSIRDVYKFVREEVSHSRQGYIVYPLVAKSPASELKAAVQMYEKLKTEEFQTQRMGLIHGQMPGAEKEKVMQKFKQHQLDILVSTTVIEVGVDVPNASVMVVEHAQRFGLSQLHQLRGRIGRGAHPSYCILVADPETEKAKMRIEAMLNIQDGFRLAEEDLNIRGPGEFFGPAQHGLPELRIGNIIKDVELMELARKEAFSLVEKSPDLQEGQFTQLRRRLWEKFRHTNLGLLST